MKTQRKAEKTDLTASVFHDWAPAELCGSQHLGALRRHSCGYDFQNGVPSLPDSSACKHPLSHNQTGQVNSGLVSQEGTSLPAKCKYAAPVGARPPSSPWESHLLGSYSFPNPSRLLPAGKPNVLWCAPSGDWQASLMQQISACVFGSRAAFTRWRGS